MPIDFQLIEKDGGSTNRAIASWERGQGGFTASFVVKYRIGKGSFTKVETTNTSITVDGVKPGKKLEVQVKAVGVGFPRKTSGFAIATATAPSLNKNLETAQGVTAEQFVANLTEVSIAPISGVLANLGWVPPINQNLSNLVAIIKHSPKTDGTASFADSVELSTIQATASNINVPLMNGEYIVKLQDQTTGVKSAEAVKVIINIPDALPKLLIETRREDQDSPPFQGEKKGVFYSDEYDGLVLDGDSTIDDALLIDDLSEIDFVGDRLLSGEYEFPTVLDLGGKFEANLERTLDSRGLYPSDLIDDRSALVDSWTDWDGALAEDTSAVVYFRVSNDAPTENDILLEATPDLFLLEDGDKLLQESSTQFGEWTVLNKSTFVGRSFQFKAELETDHIDQTPLVDQLGYKFSIPSRTESSATIASGAAAKAVTFTNAFYQAPTVGVSVFNLVSGDYYEVTSVTRTGFTVHFKNSSNSSVNRNFQYVAAGFGSEQT